MQSTECRVARNATNIQLYSTSRGTRALAALVVLAHCGIGRAAEPVRVGLIFSDTGTMTTSERPLKAATLVAIDAINASGGVLGRHIEPVIRDGASDPEEAARHAEDLITREGVVALFGCWTSACRKAVMRVVEHRNGILFYPVQYEGVGLGDLPLDPSPRVVYSGAAPNQQLIPAVIWALERRPRARVFLVGSDYVFPRSANALIRDVAARMGGEVVGEAYQPLGTGDFRQIVKDIEALRPDVIFNTVNGLDNSRLFNELSSIDRSGDRYLTISLSVDENLTDEIGWGRFVGQYAAWNYFHDPGNPRTPKLLQEFRSRLGSEAVRTSDPVEAAHIQVYVFALAARRAASTFPDAVLSAARGLVLQSFAGVVRVDPENRHLWKRAVVGRFSGDSRLFAPVWQSDYPLRPDADFRAQDPELLFLSGFGRQIASSNDSQMMLASGTLTERLSALSYYSRHRDSPIPLSGVSRSLTSPGDWTEYYLATELLVADGSADAQEHLAKRLLAPGSPNDGLFVLEMLNRTRGLRQVPQPALIHAAAELVRLSTDPVSRASGIRLLTRYPDASAPYLTTIIEAGSGGDPSVAVEALRAAMAAPRIPMDAVAPLQRLLGRSDLGSAPGLAAAACELLDALGDSWSSDLPSGGIAAYRLLTSTAAENLRPAVCPAALAHAETLESRSVSQWIAEHQPESLEGWLVVLVGLGALLLGLVRLTQIGCLLVNPGRFMRSVRPFRPFRFFGLERRFPLVAEIANVGRFFGTRPSVLNRWIIAHRPAFATCSAAGEDVGGATEYQPLLIEEEMVAGNASQRTPNDEYFVSVLSNGGSAQILGEGGVGKTTLAIELLRVAQRTPIGGREILALLIRADEIGDIENHQAILDVIQRQLGEALRTYRRQERTRQHELADAGLIRALIEGGHLLLIIDDLSRSVGEQWRLASNPAFRSWFPLIVYTGRRSVTPRATIDRIISPQPIDRNGLVSFVNTQLSIRGSGALGSEEIEEIHDRLDDLFGWRARVPAMFARLIADEVERQRSEGQDPKALEISLPELVISYVARTVADIPRDRAASLDPSQAWRALGSLSWACLENRLSVTPVSREEAITRLKPFGDPESTLVSICNEARLAHQVANDRIVMASDALAEYLAALWLFDSKSGCSWTDTEQRIARVLDLRPSGARIDEPARTFLSALLDVAERSTNSSSGAMETVSAQPAAIATISQWLEIIGHAKPPIKVGVLFSRTGAMAISEQPVQEATLLAIRRINARGGIRGRRIIPISVDGGSDPRQFASQTKDLLRQDVVSIFGCWTSASRIEVLRVLEKQGGLLFYPVQYEGYESSRHALYFGAAPNQQLLPAVDWCVDIARLKRFLIVGSDYVFPRIASEILVERIAERRSDGAELLREPLYVDLTEPKFDVAFQAIRELRPDVILNTINGAGNLEFFWRLWSSRAGTDNGRPPRVMSFSIGDYEAQRIGIEVTAGHYASWNYFSTMEGHANNVFLRGMRGRNLFFPSDPAESAYTQVLAFARAAELVIDGGDGDLSSAAIRAAALGIEVDSPSGGVRIDPENGHVYKVPRIGELGADGMFSVTWAAKDPLKPDPFPYPDLTKRVDSIRSKFHPAV